MGDLEEEAKLKIAGFISRVSHNPECREPCGNEQFVGAGAETSVSAHDKESRRRSFRRGRHAELARE